MTATRIGPRELASLLGSWRSAAPSLADALVAATRNAILEGRLPVGRALPSERAVADTLGVSRGTVVAALAALRRDGWVHTAHGSGSETRLPPWAVGRTTPWALDHPGEDGLELDLSHAVTSAPHRAVTEATRAAGSAIAPLLLDDGLGDRLDPGLRDVIAARYTADGLQTAPEQVLVTAGARAALLLLLDEFHDTRNPVLVENPTYHDALAVLRGRGARLVPIPVSADGWEFDRVGPLRRGSLAYLVPDFHNPTGALMSEEQRRECGVFADRHGLTLVVDETMRDLDLRVPPVPIPRIAGAGTVHVGSASKTIWGGTRIGWVRAGTEVIRRLRRNPLTAALSPGPLAQLVARSLLASIEPLLAERRAQLRQQRDHLVTALADDDLWEFAVPDGGLTVWIRLHRASAHHVVTRARRAGLALAPGPTFTVDGSATDRIRFPFTAHPAALDRATGILKQVAANA